MTILTTPSFVTVQGNNATTVFNYGFEIPFQADGLTPAVAVWFYDTAAPANIPIQLAVNLYTIAGVGNPLGGTITYPLTGPPMTPTQSLTIKRALLEVQATAVPNQSFFPNVVENVADTEMMVIQQIQEQLGRAIIGSSIDTPTTMGTLPPPIVRAGELLGFDPVTGAIKMYTIGPSGAVTPTYTIIGTAINYVGTGLEDSIEVSANSGLVQITLSPALYKGRRPVRVKKMDTTNNAVTIFNGAAIVDAIITPATATGKIGGWRDVSSDVTGTILRVEGNGG